MADEVGPRLPSMHLSIVIQSSRYNATPIDGGSLQTICRVFQKRHEALTNRLLTNPTTGIGINVFQKVSQT
jgi:hypothetical protein